MGSFAQLRSGSKPRIVGEADLFAQIWRKPSTRSRFESLIDGLELPDDWTVEEFICSLERMRGRPIVRLPLPDPAPVGVCGLWLARPDDDVMFYRRAVDPMMERHVVGHEAAHMLLDHGHGRSPAELALLWAGVGPDGELASGSATIKSARGASPYCDRAEWEAELLATMIMMRARKDGTLRRDRMLRLF